MPSIRFEQAGNETYIADVNSAAFGQDDETRLVDKLRELADPSISLVALVNDRIVGHILSSPVSIGDEVLGSRTLALGPMAVTPEHQRCGVGSALVRAGLEACARGSHDVVFVLGDPAFYSRFGFRAAAPLGLRFRSEEFDPYFMVTELVVDALSGRRGLVRYLPPFSEV